MRRRSLRSERIRIRSEHWLMPNRCWPTIRSLFSLSSNGDDSRHRGLLTTPTPICQFARGGSRINARGIIEIPNRLKASKTAIVVVHPWGIDDGQGWKTPEPAGAAFGCTPEKNQLMLKHGKTVINPFLKSLRSKVGLIVYSLPGSEDSICEKLYRSIHRKPSDSERKQGRKELTSKLQSFNFQGEPIPRKIELTSGKPAIDYFRQFPGLDAGTKYNNRGFWNLPTPIMKSIEVARDDVVAYDVDGYAVLKVFLQENGIEHVLLCGYHADMCVRRNAVGFENLRRDFNVFLVGDAVQATLPANSSSKYATNQAVSFASLNLFITQVSWVKLLQKAKTALRQE